MSIHFFAVIMFVSDDDYSYSAFPLILDSCGTHSVRFKALMESLVSHVGLFYILIMILYCLINLKFAISISNIKLQGVSQRTNLTISQKANLSIRFVFQNSLLSLLSSIQLAQFAGLPSFYSVIVFFI